MNQSSATNARQFLCFNATSGMSGQCPGAQCDKCAKAEAARYSDEKLHFWSLPELLKDLESGSFLYLTPKMGADLAAIIRQNAAPQVPATARSGERLDTTTPAVAALSEIAPTGLPYFATDDMVEAAIKAGPIQNNEIARITCRRMWKAMVEVAVPSAIGTPEVSLSGFPLHVHAGNRYMRSILIYNDNSIPEGTAELRGIDGRTLVKIVNLGD